MRQGENPDSCAVRCPDWVEPVTGDPRPFLLQGLTVPHLLGLLPRLDSNQKPFEPFSWRREPLADDGIAYRIGVLVSVTD